MRTAIRYLLVAAAVLAVSIGTYRLLPASIGKAPSAGHGDQHGDEHGHDEQSATMNDAKIAAAGIELDTAGPVVLRETLRVNGILQANQEALVQVTPRFPGVIRELRKRVGDQVASGETLARVESNQSLTSYELKAPIAGTVIERQAALGEYVSEQKPAFVVADLTSVWADFAIARRDLRRVKNGDTVVIDPEDGGDPIAAKISYVAPVGASETQSALARAVVANDGRLRPGLFVTGNVVMAEKPIPLAIKLAALQSLDGRTVVFVRSGDKFEPREVELGQRDSERVEILFGVTDGEVYAAKNSFIVKAEIGKASAAHEH
ncbi:MAG: efflux RND transporter periplasmic adaptor subunit [Pseudolabrys sp.]|nr:efflux RND transporter periplasmic adaptor subunit [Pseudolabrys sp.]